MKINWDLKSALIERFGSQVQAARLLGIREAKLSYIVRGHTKPSDRELKALKGALGRGGLQKLRTQRRTRRGGVRNSATNE